MNDIVENLITVVDDLYTKQHMIDEIALSLLGIKDGLPSGPGLLYELIYKIELILVEYLGGEESHLSYCKEIKKEKDPFYNLNQGIISRSEFLNQIKRIIDLDLRIE